METSKPHNLSMCACADPVLGEYISCASQEMSHHRVEGQAVKCGFGVQGVCCRLCANGPCRVSPMGERGVCGADADTIVARNFLRAIACGSGCYTHVLENTVRRLAEVAKNKAPIKSEAALNRLAQMLGVETDGSVHEIAAQVAELIRSDLYRPADEKMELTAKMAFPPRLKRWMELDILPGGAKSEVFEGVVKTSTNLSSDPVDMLMHCLRLGISTGLYGLRLTNLINDVLHGQPELELSSVGLSVVDPDYINIMVTGHQQALFSALMEEMASQRAVELAQSCGAKGFRLVGCTCVGQDLQLRGAHCKEIYVGNAGNNFTSEAILSTGGIDGVVTEFNCTLPGIEPICEQLHISQVCIDNVAKKKNAEQMPCETAEEAYAVLEHIAKGYQQRRKTVTLRLLPEHGNQNTLSGVSELSLKGFLGDSWKPLIDLIASGKIKGIVGMVGCSSVADGHDTLTAGMTRELIKRDILVLSAGCTSSGLANCGFMTAEAIEWAGDSLKSVCKSLGIPPVLNFGPCLAIARLEMVAEELAAELQVDLPQLPLALSAAQWLEEQALADGTYGLALGLPLHLGKPPFISGSPVVTQTLTEGMKDLTGGELIIEGDAVRAVDRLEQCILQKRTALGI